MSWVWHQKRCSNREPDWNVPLPDDRSSRLEYLYAWERRCRGYELHPYPGGIEPAFTPYHPDSPSAPSQPLPAVSSVPWSCLCHLSLQLPQEQKVTVASVSSVLPALPVLSQPLSFEIIGTRREIVYQFTCPKESAEGVISTAQMHWPKASFESGSDALELELSPQLARGASARSFVVEFGLQQFAFLPLACFDSFTTDPLAGVLAGLGTMADGEVAGLQVLFTPADARWNQPLLRVAQEFEEAPQNLRAPHGGSPLLAAAHVKLSQPLYAAIVRVFALSDDGESRAFTVCKKIGSALNSFNLSAARGGNAFLALANEDPHSTANSPYPPNGSIFDVFNRTSHRSGMLLSLAELTGLVHPPSETVQHPKLVRLDPNARSLSEVLLQAEGATIGLHSYRNQQQALVWPDEYRNRHAYILGATRMGKSTLLLNLIHQDIHMGRGLCLIDPHGDLAHDVLARVPPERAGDVLYLDLSDREYPLALGLLEARDEHERRLLCSDLLSVMKRLFASSWGDRLEHILRHAILTLLAAKSTTDETDGACYTLRDIRPLLTNKAFRERVVAHLEDTDLQAFWSGEFGSYSASTFAPLYNKLGVMFSNPVVRNIIAGRQSKLSFADVIEKKRILLVNLAGSQIGSESAHFLGALLVSKLQIAAMANLRLGKDERTPFTLYVDEFQNFVVSSFEVILSEAGKAGLSLVMANQFLEQLSSQLQTAILSNAGTLCSFRVSSDSGRLLEKEFAGRFKSHDLVSLSRGEAIVRVGSAADSYDIHTLPPAAATRAVSPDLIRQISREAICRPRSEVEAELTEDARRQEEEQKAAEQEEAERKQVEKSAKAEKAATSKPPTAMSEKTVMEKPKKKRNNPRMAQSIEQAEPAGEEEEAPQKLPEVSKPKTAVPIVANEFDTVQTAPETQPITPLEPDCFGVPE